MSAALDPSTLATMIRLILNTFSLLAALLSTVVWDVSESAMAAVLPKTVVIPTMLGLAIFSVKLKFESI